MYSQIPHSQLYTDLSASGIQNITMDLAGNFLPDQNYTRQWAQLTGDTSQYMQQTIALIDNKETINVPLQDQNIIMLATNNNNENIVKDKEERDFPLQAQNIIIKDNILTTNNNESIVTDWNTMENNGMQNLESIQNSNYSLTSPNADGAVLANANKQDRPVCLRNSQYNWRFQCGMPCAHCKEVFRDRSSYEKHLKEEHPSAEMVYTCSICKKQFSNYDRFRNHCYRHLISGRYKCEACPRSFSQYSHLQAHMQGVHEAAPGCHQCPLCPRSFLTSKGLASHMRLAQHAQAFTCEQCDKQLHSAAALKVHLASHRGEQPFMCDICGQRFRQKFRLQLHVKQHEPNQRLKCSACPKSFLNKEALSHHVRHVSHCNVRSFQCTICHKNYKTERCLRVHSFTHTERPFICSVCGKGFITNNKLKQHNNIHTGERPYQCQFCNMAFTNYPNCLKHTKRKHPNGISIKGSDSNDNSICMGYDYAVPSVATSENSMQSFETDSSKIYYMRDGDLHSVDSVYSSDLSLPLLSNNDMSDLSNIDGESVVSMDSPENSVLFYNKLMEKECDSINNNYAFPDANSVPDYLSIDESLNLDQNENLPHNGWQKLNLREVSIEPEAFQLEQHTKQDAIGFSDLIKDGNILDKHVDFADESFEDLDSGVFADLSDQDLELSHSYVREQAEACAAFLTEEETDYITPFVTDALHLTQASVSHDDGLLPLAASPLDELPPFHFHPELLEGPLSPILAADEIHQGCDDSLNLHSTSNTAKAEASNADQLNNTHRKLSTSPALPQIFQTKGGVVNLTTQNQSNAYVTDQPLFNMTHSQCNPNVPATSNSTNTEAETLLYNDLLHGSEKIFSPNSINQKNHQMDHGMIDFFDMDPTDVTLQFILNNLDVSPSAGSQMEQAYPGNSCLSEILSSQMLTHSMLEDKCRSNDAPFLVTASQPATQVGGQQ